MKYLPFIFVLILIPFAILFIALIRLLYPLFKIRLCKVTASRFGHFIGNFEYYLIYKKNVEKKSFIDLFYLEKPISNLYLAEKIRNKNNIIPNTFGKSLFLIYKFLKVISVSFFDKIFLDYRNFDRDNYNLLDKTKPSITFNNDEISLGQKFLSQIGVGDNQKFVVLITRDNAYMKKYLNNSWKSNDYRNSKVKNFEKAVQYLIKQGLFVIRIGKLTENKLRIKNKNFFDYSKSKLKSDFLDIFLTSKCLFAISDTSGLLMAPIVFRKKIACVNVAPLSYVYLSSKNYFFIPKHFKNIKKKRNISLSEIKDKKLGRIFTSAELKKNNVRLVENSGIEIYELVREVYLKMIGKWKIKTNEIKLQKKFRNQFQSDEKDQDGITKLHNKINSYIGYNFLKKNTYFLRK